MYSVFRKETDGDKVDIDLEKMILTPEAKKSGKFTLTLFAKLQNDYSGIHKLGSREQEIEIIINEAAEEEK